MAACFRVRVLRATTSSQRLFRAFADGDRARGQPCYAQERGKGGRVYE